MNDLLVGELLWALRRRLKAARNGDAHALFDEFAVAEADQLVALSDGGAPAALLAAEFRWQRHLRAETDPELTELRTALRLAAGVPATARGVLSPGLRRLAALDPDASGEPKDWLVRMAPVPPGADASPDVLDEVIGALEVLHRVVEGKVQPLVLGILSCMVFQRLGDSMDLSRLDEAIDLGTRAAKSLPPGHEVRWPILSNRAMVLRRRFKVTGHPLDIDAAIDAGRAACEERPADALVLSGLAIALSMRYQIISDPSDLADGIAHGRSASDLMADGDPERGVTLTHLASMLLARARRTKDANDLDEALDFVRAAEGLRGAHHVEHTRNVMTDVLTERLAHSGKLTELIELERWLRRQLDDHGRPPSFLERLVTVLAQRFDLTQDVRFLDEAVVILRELADGAAAPDARRGHMLRAGVLLRARAEITSSVVDLVDGVLYSVRSVATSPDIERPDLACLRRRLRDLAATGDFEHLRAPAAVAEVMAAVDTEAIPPDLEAHALAGWILWLRAPYSDDRGRQEAERVADMLRPVFLLAPGAVPDEWAAAWAEDGMTSPDLAHVSERASLSPADGQRGNLSGLLLLERFIETGEGNTLAASIRMFRRAVEAAPAGEQKAVAYNNLSMALQRSGMLSSSREVFAEAVEAARRAVALSAHDAPYRPGRLNLLSAALHNLGVHDDDLDLLREAVHTGELGVEITPADHPSRGSHLANLFTVQVTERQYSGDIDGMREAVGRLQHAWELLPLSHHHHISVCLSFAKALHRLAAAADETEPLRRSERLLRGTLDQVQGSARLLVLTVLTTTLDLLGRRTGEERALTDAVEFGRQLIAGPRGLNAAKQWTDHAARCSVLHAHTRDEALIDEGIGLLRQVRAAAAPGRLGWYTLRVLSMLLRWKAEDTGDPSFIEEAEQVSRQAVASAPEDLEPLAEHSYVLLILHRMTGSLAALRSASNSAIEVLDRTEPGDPAHDRRGINVLEGLQSLHELTGEPGVRDQGVRVARALLRQAPAQDSPWRLMLASLLALRADDLQDAADLFSGYLRATSADDPDRRKATSDLGSVLLHQFLQTGVVDFLREAIGFLRTDTQGASPAGRNSLALSLRMLYHRTGDPAALAEALDVGRDLVAVTRPGTAYRSLYIANLASYLMDQWQLTGETTLLRHSVEASRAAVVASGADRAYRADHLSVLAQGLLMLASQDTGEDHGAEAVRVARAGVGLGGEAHQNRLAHLFVLGRALAAEGMRKRDPQVLTEARDIQANAAALPGGSPRERLKASQEWAACAMRLDDPHEAERAYRYAVGILTEYVGPGLAWGDREHGIDEAGALPGDAAAAAIAAGHPEEAVALLEQSRGMLLAEALHSRIDLRELEAKAPELAKNFRRVSSDLRDIELLQSDAVGGAPPPVWAARRRLDLGREWRQICERVRKTPGFEGFLAPPSLSAVRDATRGGTLVIVNISVWRCDALLVTSDSTEVLPLPDLSAQGCVEQANHYLRAFQEHEAALQAVVEARSEAGRSPGAGARHRLHEAKLALRAARTAVEKMLGACLSQLWDEVAGPVADHLGLEPGGRDRLWWCPTGPLALLPLHAAGHAGDLERDLLDRAVSSYIPTLRALVTAHQSPTHAPEPKMLTVALANTPGQNLLPNVVRERDQIHKLFPPPDGTVLADATATRKNVLAALARHSWVHFSCHAQQNMRTPAESCLLLADGELTIADLIAERPSGEFAFLSACRTGAVGVTLPNESITLASALHYAGYRHVIATMWSVYDAAAADLALTTYDGLTSAGSFQPTGAGRALHASVLALRAIYPEQPSVWAPFVHIGV